MYAYLNTRNAEAAAAFRIIEAERRPVAGDPIACERCGAIADADWLDTSTWNDPGPVLIMGRSSCVTPGCVNERGSRSVLTPDDPGRLLTQDDHAWVRRQYQLAAEYANADRLLQDAFNAPTDAT